MPQQSMKSSSSTMSSFMCCTSERSSKTFAYKESQSKFLWLDPTRWVEKRSKKQEVSQIQTKKQTIFWEKHGNYGIHLPAWYQCVI